MATNEILWPGYQEWLMVTPDQAANGDAAQFKGPEQNMNFLVGATIQLVATEYRS